MRKAIFREVCFTVLVTTAGIPVRTAVAGPETGGAHELADVVVTPTRGERPAAQTPAYLDVLSTEDLRLGQAVRSMPEALELQTGTMVQKTAHGQGSPYIRGFTSYRNLLLVDGVRLNNSAFRDGPNQYWNTVDPYSISQLEFVRGPFSVLYGSDAVGGTVNAITIGARDLRPDHAWDRRLHYRYSTAEDSHIARAETIGRLAQNLVMTLGYTFKSFGDLEGGRDVGTQEKTGYDELDWDAKLEYFPDDETTVVLAHQGVDMNDAWRTHKTIYGIDWKGLSVGDDLRRALDQDRKLTYLQFSKEGLGPVVDELRAGLSHHLQEEQQDRLRTRDRRDTQGFEVNTLGAFLQLKSPSRAGDWVYGAEVYHDDVDSHQHTLNPDGSIKSTAIQGPVGDAATYDTAGLYLQDEIPVADRLSIILGGRYEHIAADADSVEDPDSGERISIADNWNSLVGSVRALYALNADKTCSLFAGASQGFRAPNLSDLTRFDAARTDEIETPAPGLDPETFMAYELGLKGGNPTFSGQLAYFYTDIQDMIVRTPTGRIVDGNREVTKRNAGDGYIHGIEAEADWRLAEFWTLYGRFTWMDGQVDTYPTSDPISVEETLDRLMPMTGRFGIRWDARRYWAEAACTVAAKADKLSTSDAADTSRIPPGGTPGYTVCDLRGGWRLSESLTVSLAVENIGDEDYRVHGSGVNEAGRNVVVATEWVF